MKNLVGLLSIAALVAAGAQTLHAEPSSPYDRAREALFRLLKDKPLCPDRWLLMDEGAWNGIVCESNNHFGPVLLSKDELERADFWIVNVRRSRNGSEPRLIKVSDENHSYDVALQTGAIGDVIRAAKSAQGMKKSRERMRAVSSDAIP